MNAPYPELDQRLAALRAHAQQWSPPARVDAAVAAAARNAQGTRARLRRMRQHWIAWPLALAASVVIVSIALRGVSSHPAGDEASAAAPPRPSFTPIVPMAEIQQTADALVVPARVPRMTLAQYGLPLDPARADDPVNTELLVRRDGAVLAYRLVKY
jgi:hypothetical protein